MADPPDPPSDELPDGEPNPELRRAYRKGRADGRRKAEEKARQKAQKTERPSHPTEQLAHNLGQMFLHHASVLGSDEYSKADKDRSSMQVLQAVRALEIPPKDSAKNRRIVFSGCFERACRQYKSTRDIYTAPIRHLPRDPASLAKLDTVKNPEELYPSGLDEFSPGDLEKFAAEIFENQPAEEQERLRRLSRKLEFLTQAEVRVWELLHRRNHELLPRLAPWLAEGVVQEFSRLYPDEEPLFDSQKLAEAIEAICLGSKEPGRKQSSKYATLEAAVRRNTFAEESFSWKTALKTAAKREEERAARLRESSQNHQQSPGGEADER